MANEGSFYIVLFPRDAFHQVDNINYFISYSDNYTACSWAIFFRFVSDCLPCTLVVSIRYRNQFSYLFQVLPKASLAAIIAVNLRGMFRQFNSLPRIFMFSRYIILFDSFYWNFFKNWFLRLGNLFRICYINWNWNWTYLRSVCIINITWYVLSLNLTGIHIISPGFMGLTVEWPADRHERYRLSCDNDVTIM